MKKDSFYIKIFVAMIVGILLIVAGVSGEDRWHDCLAAIGVIIFLCAAQMGGDAVKSDEKLREDGIGKRTGHQGQGTD